MAKKQTAPALVPEAEQPYPVPGNWVWTYAGNLVTMLRGVSYKKGDAHKDKREHDVLIMRGGNIAEGHLDISADTDNVYVSADLVTESQYVRKDDIIIVSSTGSKQVIGRAGISPRHYTDVSFGAFLMLLRPHGMVNPRLVGWFFQGVDYRNRIRDLAVGTNINNLRGNYIAQMPFPLPPLPEQQRIVDRIESLFTKLDEAREKARAVVDGYELRKAAILHKAFTGELTAKWREKQGIGLDSWSQMKLGEIGEIITGSTPDTKKEEYFGGRIPFIKPAELNQGRRVSVSKEYLTQAGKEVSRPVPAGTICVCCIGATIGKCGLLAVDAVTNQQINSIIPYDFMDNLYVYYYCCGSDFKNTLVEHSHATTLPIISKGRVSELPVPVPSVSEQIEISRLIDNIAEEEAAAKAAAETVLTTIDVMKKKILGMAFRGLLGTNDPAEARVSV